MRLYLSYIAARLRDGGEVSILEDAHCYATQAATGNAHVVQRAAEMLAAEGDKDRGKYSHILIVIDNQITGSYEFPNPEDEAEKQRLLEKQAKIVLLTQEIAALEKSAEAVALIPVALAAVREEIALKREALEILQPTPAPVEKPVEEKPFNSGFGSAEDLATLTDDDLEKAARAYELDAADFLTDETTLDRPKLIEAILEKAGYKSE